jgi:opacity protein-like surface antigen
MSRIFTILVFLLICIEVALAQDKKTDEKFFVEEWDEKLHRYRRVYVNTNSVPNKRILDNAKTVDSIKKDGDATVFYDQSNYQKHKESNILNNFIHKPFDYLQVKVGRYFSRSVRTNAQLSNETESYVFGAVLGKKLTQNFASDLEYGYRHPVRLKMYNINSQNTTIQEWSAGSHTLTINGRFSVPFDFWFPYVRGGIGVSLNKAGDYRTSSYNNSSSTTWPGKTKSSFAWQIGAGICVFHKQAFSSIFEYMHINRGKFSTKSFSMTRSGNNFLDKDSLPKTGDLIDHVVMYGLMFGF